MSDAIVKIEGLTKRFGAVDGRRRRRSRDRARRAVRPAGRLGLRQDHAAAPAGGLRDARRGPHPDRRPGHDRRAAASAAGQHDVPVLRPVPAHGRGGERRLRAAPRGRGQGRDRHARRRGAGAGAARRTMRTRSPRSSPAASASAWRWPARWSSGPSSCCSTSRWPRSTASCARARASSWCACRSSSASPS